jgi:hypothetical protein
MKSSKKEEKRLSTQFREGKAIGRRELEGAFMSLLEDFGHLFNQLGLEDKAQEEICLLVRRRCELQLKSYDGSATPLEEAQARCQPNPFVVKAQASILTIGGHP